jgi:hypothetical protein
MIIEITCSAICIVAIRAISKAYKRRRDVLYGPYITPAE